MLQAQDHARSFAGSASDEAKYKFYMKANGFDAIMERLTEAEKHVFAHREILETDYGQLKAPSLLVALMLSTGFPSHRTTNHTAQRVVALFCLKAAKLPAVWHAE